MSKKEDVKSLDPVLVRILVSTVIHGHDVNPNQVVKVSAQDAQDLVDSGEGDSVKEAVDYALTLNPDVIDLTQTDVE